MTAGEAAGRESQLLVGDTASQEHTTAVDGLFYVVVALFLGIFTKQALGWTRLPFTVLLLIWGMLLGIGNETYTKDWHYLRPGILFWESIDPDFFLSLFLPVLLFGGAFALDWHTLRRCLSQVLLLAAPGVVIGTTLTALVIRYVLPYDWSWSESLLFGAILSATDPVAVVALLREVGASKKLRVLVDGEALLNDGSAYVLFLLFQKYAEGVSQSPAGVVRQLCRLSLGGPAVGMAFGIGVVFWLRFIYSDAVVEITMTIVAAYGAFVVGNEILGVSGVLAVVVLGIWMSATGAHHISRQVHHSLHVVWEELEYIANVLVFVLSGTIIASRIYLSARSGNGVNDIKGEDYGYAVVLWLFLLVIRAIMFAVLWPLLKGTGYSISVREAAVMVWAGLRGAVGLALALFVLLDDSIGDTRFRVLVFFHTAIVAVLTILVQGPTTRPLLQVLGLLRRDPVKHGWLAQVVHMVERAGQPALDAVRHSDLLGDPDVHRIHELTSLDAAPLLAKYDSHLERGSLITASSKEERMAAVARRLNRARLLAETRSHLLRAVKGTYEEAFERALTGTAHVYHLKRSCDKALDHVDRPLTDWHYLKQRLRIPRWLRVVQQWENVAPGIRIGARAAQAWLYAWLENTAVMVIAFHYAHTDAQASIRQYDMRLGLEEEGGGGLRGLGLDLELHTLLEQMRDNVVLQVIAESEAEVHKAEGFLHALRASFPEVLSGVRTKQVAQELLLSKEEEVEALATSGLMDQLELEELQLLVERKLKQLHFEPPSVPVTTLRVLLRQHPLFADLPLTVFRDQVLPAAHVELYDRNEVLTDTKAGSQVFVIMRGVVRLEAGRGSERTMAEAGAVLGLAPLLLGQRMPLRLTASTIVQAFVIPAGTMQRAMRMVAAMEQRAWQVAGAQLLQLYVRCKATQHLALSEVQELFLEGRYATHAQGDTLRTTGPACLLWGQVAKQGAADGLPAGPLRQLSSSETATAAEPSSPSRTAADGVAGEGAALPADTAEFGQASPVVPSINMQSGHHVVVSPFASASMAQQQASAAADEDDHLVIDIGGSDHMVNGTGDSAAISWPCLLPAQPAEYLCVTDVRVVHLPDSFLAALGDRKAPPPHLLLTPAASAVRAGSEASASDLSPARHAQQADDLLRGAPSGGDASADNGSQPGEPATPRPSERPSYDAAPMSPHTPRGERSAHGTAAAAGGTSWLTHNLWSRLSATTVAERRVHLSAALDQHLRRSSERQLMRRASLGVRPGARDGSPTRFRRTGSLHGNGVQSVHGGAPAEGRPQGRSLLRRTTMWARRGGPE